MRSWLILPILLISALGDAAQGPPPLALAVQVSGLGHGAEGTVMGMVVQVAPEDRDRLGERARLALSLVDEDRQVVDRHSAVVSVQQDGSMMLYREWPVGSYELQVSVAAVKGAAEGLWIGDIQVPALEEAFTAPEGATPDAVALEMTPPADGAVRFLPPPDIGGIGAVQLEVQAPDDTRSVEFFQDGEAMGRRNRPPWTVSVPLGEIVRRTTVRAVARDGSGRFLGEDAVVLNNPTGQVGVEVLLAPEGSIRDGKRQVTVAVTSLRGVRQIRLSLDDRAVARWAECPCIAELPVAELDRATILSAEAMGDDGVRGDAVLTLAGGSGFVGAVHVELVELPVVVLDARGIPLTGLDRDDFTVLEDDRPVTLEGFGTTADLPLSLAVAVDTSGSMEEEFGEVRRAVTGFADNLLQEGDQVTLVRFSWDAEVVVGWTEDKDSLDEALARFTPEGGTSLHDAVVRSLEEFRGRRGRQALVLLTDGEDTTSRTGWKIAERFAHTMRIPVFPIGLGLGRLDFGSRGVLNSLAAETGGEAFYPKRADQLPQVYSRISELLRSQYVLWYRSSSDRPPEAFRTVTVEVDRPDVTVRTISGYYPGK